MRVITYGGTSSCTPIVSKNNTLASGTGGTPPADNTAGSYIPSVQSAPASGSGDNNKENNTINESPANVTPIDSAEIQSIDTDVPEPPVNPMLPPSTGANNNTGEPPATCSPGQGLTNNTGGDSKVCSACKAGYYSAGTSTDCTTCASPCWASGALDGQTGATHCAFFCPNCTYPNNGRCEPCPSGLLSAAQGYSLSCPFDNGGAQNGEMAWICDIPADSQSGQALSEQCGH